MEVYYNPPYTNGGIEKASANLIAFDKTDVLEPGASQTLTLSFAKEDMASYDYQNAKAYVLEEGDYVLSINSDSHNVIDSKTVTVDSTIVYSGDSKRSSDVITVTNQFDYAAGEVTYLSRADQFANYAQATAAPATCSLPDTHKATFINNSNYNPENYNNDSDVMPTTGAKNAIQLADLKGAAYDDEKWEQLLDNLTVSDMDTIIAIGGYQTSAASSVGKLGTVDCDGPASINNNFTGTGSIGFSSAVMIACTWNEDIADAFGQSIGKIAASAILGAEKHGVYAYIKHFAMNDQETNRCSMLCTWSNEQAIREIYLKPFEISVKEGGAKAVMSSFNYIGTQWAGGSSPLCNTVLRDEWGFKGFVLTDYFGVYGYMNSDQAIRNGTDAMLVAYDTATNHVKDTASATGLNAMRQACKNVMYTVVNSRAYEPENMQSGLMAWQIAAIVIDIILAAGIVALEVVSVKKFQKRRKEDAASAGNN